eukprot:1835337-Rhodomonas_salina.1
MAAGAYGGRTGPLYRSIEQEHMPYISRGNLAFEAVDLLLALPLLLLHLHLRSRLAEREGGREGGREREREGGGQEGGGREREEGERWLRGRRGAISVMRVVSGAVSYTHLRAHETEADL